MSILYRASSRTRTRRNLLSAGLLAFALLFALPSTASAHSSVSGTTPADGDVIATAPEQYIMTFNEKVTVPDGFFRIVDAKGNLTPLNGVLTTPKENGTVATVDLPNDLNGWYALGWKAISSDGHEVEGTVSFVVGSDNRTGSTTKAEEKLRVDPLAKYRVIGTILRSFNYTATLLAVGALGFLFALRRARRRLGEEVGEDIDRPTVRIATFAAIFGALSAPASLFITTLLLNGGDTKDIGTAFSIQVGTPVGLAQLIRVSAFFAMCTAVLLLVERSTRKFGVAIGALASMALVYSFSLSGHATIVPGDTVAPIALVIHLAAGALWLGGIPALAFTLRKAKGRPAVTVALVDAFSFVATISVLAIFPAAVALSWNMFTTLPELWQTAYGQRVMLKFAVVAIIALVGAYNHFVLVPALRENPAANLKKIRRSVGVEVIGLVLVVTATTLLTNQGAPAAGGSHVDHLGGPSETLQSPSVAQEIADKNPTIARAPFGDGEVDVSVLPGRAGVPNALTIRFTDAAGGLLQVSGPVKVSIKLPGADLAPFERTAAQSADGNWKLTVNDFGFAGAWEVTVTASTGALSTESGTVTIAVKAATDTTAGGQK